MASKQRGYTAPKVRADKPHAKPRVQSTQQFSFGAPEEVPLSYQAMPQNAGQGAPSQKGKQSKRRIPLIPVAFSVLLVTVLALLAYSFLMDPGRSDTFFEGVHVGSVHVGGMTQEQAQTALINTEQQLLGNWRLNLHFEGRSWPISAEDIAMDMDLDEQIGAAWQIGREGTLGERRRVIASLQSTPYYTEGGVSYDEAALNSLLESVRDEIDRDPADATATFSPESEEPFTFVDEVPGKRVNLEALKAQVKQSILSLRSEDIDVQPEDIAPQITRAMLQENLTCLVVVNTPIHSTSTEGRNENIRIALNRFNGLMLMPDERLSFNKIAGRRSDPANGYQEALEIAYGEYVSGIGGGVCQVSTTLYQAVLRSGLQVETRSPHAIPSNYADRGQDATVSDNGADFIFRNNTDLPIYIRARLTEADDTAKTKRCEISIYGRVLPNGVRYTLETRQIGGDIQPDPETEYIADNEQEYVVYEDEEEEVLPKRLGCQVETYLVELRNDGMEIGRTLVSEDLYKPRPAQVYCGVVPKDT